MNTYQQLALLAQQERATNLSSSKGERERHIKIVRDIERAFGLDHCNLVKGN